MGNGAQHFIWVARSIMKVLQVGLFDCRGTWFKSVLFVSFYFPRSLPDPALSAMHIELSARVRAPSKPSKKHLKQHSRTANCKHDFVLRRQNNLMFSLYLSMIGALFRILILPQLAYTFHESIQK